MGERPLYDTISSSYDVVRRADHRIGAHIRAALGDARRVVNVGAGTGNYEPADCLVVAVEPSGEMLAKRQAGAAPVVQGVAEHLPFPDGSFDAAMASLTVHHWTDLDAGLAEMRRVAGRQVIFTFVPTAETGVWVLDYWPEALTLASEQRAPSPRDLADHLGGEVRAVPIPFDCTDGFGFAYWGRPEAYLEPRVQQGMSFLAQLDPAIVAAGAARLLADLESGAWDRQHGHLRDLDELDAGYRLVVAG